MSTDEIEAVGQASAVLFTLGDADAAVGNLIEAQEGGWTAARRAQLAAEAVAAYLAVGERGGDQRAFFEALCAQAGA